MAASQMRVKMSNSNNSQRITVSTMQEKTWFLPFVTARSFKCNDKLISGLFHSRFLDFLENEKIILKLALSEYNVYKKQDKLLFKTNFNFDKINRQDLLPDGKIISHSIGYLQEYI